MLHFMYDFGTGYSGAGVLACPWLSNVGWDGTWTHDLSIVRYPLDQLCPTCIHHSPHVANGFASKHLKIWMLWANRKKNQYFLFNLDCKNTKMLWKHMAQDKKFLNKLNIVSHVCHFSFIWYHSYILRLWRMGSFIRHKCGERKKYCWTSLY